MSLNSLPVEILEKIMDFLAVEDLASLAQVCKRLNIEKPEKIWNSAFMKSYPRLTQRSCRAELLRMQERYGSWRDTARARAVTARELVKALDTSADDCHTMPGLPDLAMERLRALISRYGPLFIRDALLDVIYPRRANPDDNLARVHYARMLYREIQRDLVLLPMFRRFATLPPHRATPHEASHLLKLWTTPEETRPPTCTVNRFNFKVASMVLSRARDCLPLHPITAWKEPREHPFPDSSAAGWTDQEALQLLDVMNDVLYDDLQLTKNSGDAENPMLTHSRLPVHEDQGPHSCSCDQLAALYTAVAGMLGVCVHSQKNGTIHFQRWYSRDGNHCLLVNSCRFGQRFSKEEACQVYSLQERQLDTRPPRRKYIEKAQQESDLPAKFLGSADVSALQQLSVIANADFRSFHGVTMEVVSLSMYWRPMYIHRYIKDFISRSAGEITPHQFNMLTQYKDVLEELYNKHVQTIKSPPQVGWWPRDPSERQHGFRVGDLVVCPAGERAVVCIQLPFEKEDSRPTGGPLRLPQPRKTGPVYRVLIDGCKYGYLREDQMEHAENTSPIAHPDLGRFFLRHTGDRYLPVPSLERQNPARLPAHAQSEETASSQQRDSTGREERPGGESSGMSLGELKRELPREVPDTWLGEWPELH